jgi:hypothetical protein
MTDNTSNKRGYTDINGQINKKAKIAEVNSTEVNFDEICGIKEDFDIQTGKFFNTNIPEVNNTEVINTEVTNTEVNNTEVNNTEVNNTEEYLDEIYEILEDSLIEPGKFFSTNIALNLFSELSKFGLNFTNSNDKEICKSKIDENKEIPQLLGLNSLKIKNYLVYFPDLLFNDTYYPETICELRSGIKFLFDFWEDSPYEDKKLKELFDPKGSEVSDLDKSLKYWLKKHKPNITEKYPIEEHWWWQEPAKFLTIDINQHSNTATTGI